MASVGPVIMPVRLQVGSTEAGVGTVEIPVSAKSNQADGDAVAVSMVLDMDALKTNLAALLRAVADEIETGGEGGE